MVYYVSIFLMTPIHPDEQGQYHFPNHLKSQYIIIYDSQRVLSVVFCYVIFSL